MKAMLLMLQLAAVACGVNGMENGTDDHDDHDHDDHDHDDHDEHGDEHGVEEYNVNLQVAGLFVVIAASMLGIVMSYLLARQGGKESWANSAGFRSVIVFVKGVSVGVILSVALVHLIGHASHGFEDNGWNEFESWPYVFVMVGIYMMAALDLMGQRFAAGRGEVSDLAKSSDHGHAHAGLINGEPTTKDGVPVASMRITAAFVEGGILFHSVIIGLDLGLQPTDMWAIILFAISLHQFLEGLMLGQVLGELKNNDAQMGKCKVYTMIGMFSITTACGVAIGIIVRTTSSEYASPQALELTLAVLNSFAGGLLLYLGLASLLVPWFVQSATMRSASRTYVAIGFIGLAIGMAAMTAVALAEGDHAH
jgi:zinc transporter 1/2/3